MGACCMHGFLFFDAIPMTRAWISKSALDTDAVKLYFSLAGTRTTRGGNDDERITCKYGSIAFATAGSSGVVAL